MSQLKNNIIDKINALKDVHLIRALSSILDKLDTPEKQKTSPAEKELILLGLEDFKNGKLTDDEQLRKEEDEWLNG